MGAGGGDWHRSKWKERSRGFIVPLLLAASAGMILACVSQYRGLLLHQSKAPHFVYQAMAFLQGSLHSPVEPPNYEDWVLWHGRWFVSFPAFPALVMVPLVAVFGYQLNDTSFTVVVAALALMTFFLALRRLARLGDSPRTEREDLALTALMGFGTVFFYCAIRGEVWFTAEVMGVGLTSLYLLWGTRGQRPLLAGVAWSAAVLTRTPLLFAGVYFLAEVLRVSRDWSDRLKRLATFGLGGAPLALAHLWFNHARFGKWGEFGHRLFFNNRVNADIERWGLFDIHYLPRNLHAAFTRLPTLSFEPLRLGYDPHGMSLFLTTPLFFLVLASLVPAWRPERASTTGISRSLWLAAAFTAIPGFFYQNTGYAQFGFRFSLDYTPFLFALLAVGGWSMRSRLFVALAAVGVVVSTWGAFAFRGFSG